MRHSLLFLLVLALAGTRVVYAQRNASTRSADTTARRITRVAIGGVDSIRLTLVRGGSFEMGSNSHESEQPVHRVTVNSFYMSIYEITQEQWRAVMGYNYSAFSACKRCAVESVSWDEAQQFIDSLNRRSERHFRLPTEAEWEYAARGGRYTANYQYSGSNSIHQVANVYEYGTTDNRRPYPVGMKLANELGIYDMSGNVMEWCSDWYDEHYYRQRVSDNPKGPATGATKVYRGGSFLTYPQFMTNTKRMQDADIPARRNAQWITLGFRVVCDVE